MAARDSRDIFFIVSQWCHYPMQLKQFRVSLPVLLSLFSISVLMWLLWTTLQVSIVRYFDADELAYLHWAHNVYSGALPYRDFLFFVPPGFLYALAVLYIFVNGTAVLVAGRVFSFLILTGIVVVTCWMFWRIRNSWAAWFVGVVLIALPLPADKLLEIRPDNLAMFLSLLGLACILEGFSHNKHVFVWGAGGLLYGLSLLTLPKTLPQVVVSVILIVVWVYWEKEHKSDRIRSLMWFIGGLLIPMGVFGMLYAMLLGNSEHLTTMWYSLTTLPFEVGRLGEMFGMRPDLFFYPNSIYYGTEGWNTAILVNHLLWLTGLLTGCVRLVTPALLQGKRGIFPELLIAGTWFFYVLMFMYGYPLRHAQYLIPIAIFVAWFVADFVNSMWVYASRTRTGSRVFAVFFMAGLAGLSLVQSEVATSKLLMTNHEDKAVVERVLHIVPKGAFVFDLVGSTLYYKDPYYVCCVPYGQWSTYQSRPLPSLPEALERTNTQFIYQGRLMRTTTLPEADQAYIRTHFIPYQTDPSLLIRK